MARTSLGSAMEGSQPANDPGPDFEPEPFRRTYYNYKELTPDRLKDILSRADNDGRVDLLYKLYDDMEVTDTRYAGIVNQLRSTIAQMPLRNIPAEGRTKGEQEKAQEFKDYAGAILNQLDKHALVQEFAEPYIRGATLHKVSWELEDLPFNRTMYFPSSVETVEGKHLIEETTTIDEHFGELKVRTKDDPTGIPISELSDENHIFLESKQGKHEYAHLGVARKVLDWYLALRFVKTWWTQYIENYGQPLRIGKYPTGSKKSKRQKMKRFLKQMGNNGYGLFPSGMEVEMIDLNQSGKLNVHKQFTETAHQEYSIAILGQAGTTGEGREGSYAQTSVLNGIRMDIIKHVGKIVAKGFQKLVKKGLRLNYGDEFEEHLVPDIKPIVLNAQDAQSRAKAAQTLHNMGFPIPSNYPYEQILGVEKPGTGEEVMHGGKAKDLDSNSFSEELDAVQMDGPSERSRDQTTDEMGEESVTNPNNNRDET